jgi:DNA-binding response OmpR family regulator
MRSVSVAVLDSSPIYRAVIQAVVEVRGWTAQMCDRYTDLVEVLAKDPIELVVLGYSDIPAPEYELGRLLETIQIPVVVLTNDEPSVKEALRTGATLAVSKPFDPEYLLLSIEAILHRGLQLRSILSEGAAVGDLNVYVGSHTVERRGRRQVLSHTEWQLFAFLLGNPGRTYSRDELAEEAWGSGYLGRRAQIELYVSRLRKKLERDPRHPEIIETVRHRGYRLGPTPLPLEARSETVSSHRQVERETWSATAPAVLTTWMGIYRELIIINTHLIERTREILSSAGEPQREILQTDLRLMKAQSHRFEERLAVWEDITA